MVGQVYFGDFPGFTQLVQGGTPDTEIAAGPVDVQEGASMGFNVGIHIVVSLPD
jgi:hypothetical protein